MYLSLITFPIHLPYYLIILLQYNVRVFLLIIIQHTCLWGNYPFIQYNLLPRTLHLCFFVYRVLWAHLHQANNTLWRGLCAAHPDLPTPRSETEGVCAWLNCMHCPDHEDLVHVFSSRLEYTSTTRHTHTQRPPPTRHTEAGDFSVNICSLTLWIEDKYQTTFR